MKISILAVSVALLLSSCSGIDEPSVDEPSHDDCRASIRALQDRVDAIRYVAQADPTNVLILARSGEATGQAIATADELLKGSCKGHEKNLSRVQ